MRVDKVDRAAQRQVFVLPVRHRIAPPYLCCGGKRGTSRLGSVQLVTVPARGASVSRGAPCARHAKLTLPYDVSKHWATLHYSYIVLRRYSKLTILIPAQGGAVPTDNKVTLTPPLHSEVLNSRKPRHIVAQLITVLGATSNSCTMCQTKLQTLSAQYSDSPNITIHSIAVT